MNWFRRRLTGGRTKRKAKRPIGAFKLQIFVGAGLLVGISLLVWGMWHLTRLPSLTISEISIVGGETISHDVVRQIVESELEGTYLRLVPHRFIYTYPHDSIEESLRAIDRIRNVFVERTSRTSLGVAFDEYEPIALWCSENQLSQSCMFLDREGYAFAPAPPLLGAAFVRYSERGRDPKKGEYLFDQDYLKTTNAFIDDAYERLNLNIVYVERTAEDEVTYVLSGGGSIKTSLSMSTTETLRNLETILLSEEFDHIEPGNFNYIDLRFGNKVFVNEVLEELATSTDEVATSTPLIMEDSE